MPDQDPIPHVLLSLFPSCRGKIWLSGRISHCLVPGLGQGPSQGPGREAPGGLGAEPRRKFYILGAYGPIFYSNQMVLYIYAAIHASTHEAQLASGEWRTSWRAWNGPWEARRRRVHAGAWGGVIGLYTPPGSGPRDPQSYNEQHATPAPARSHATHADGPASRS